MINLVTQHGTGDTYMTLAFAHTIKDRVVVTYPNGHNAIASMFPNVISYPAGYGDMSEVSSIRYIHPTKFHGDISRFALLGRPATHADLWRAMLGLGLNEPMERGLIPDVPQTKNDTCHIIMSARSWPNYHPEFWHMLATQLEAAGWQVCFNVDSEPLDGLLRFAASAKWVIGPQCGVMAILCHALFPCRKTICTPAVEDTGWIVPTTYPYARVTTFAGEDYGDVEEVIIGSNPTTAVDTVKDGPHFNRVPVKGGVLSVIPVTLTYGDFLDRFSVLTLKTTRLPKAQAATVIKEFQQYADLFAKIANKEVVEVLCDLLLVNGKAWEHNDKAVPDALAHRPMQDHHAEAIRLNKERVQLKNKINEIVGSPIEIKSYYEENKS